MAKITVWECEETGELFREEKSYKAHLRVLARQRRAEQRAKEARDAEDVIVAGLHKLTSRSAIEKWLISHWDLIKGRYPSCRNGDLLRAEFLKHPSGSRLNFGMQGCTHSAPLGKQTNWRGDSHIPKEYPGWKGSLSMCFTSSVDVHGLTAIGICIGGGGARNCRRDGCLYHLNYDVILWAHDFKAMASKERRPWLKRLRALEELPEMQRAASWSDTGTAIRNILQRKVTSRKLTAYDDEWASARLEYRKTTELLRMNIFTQARIRHLFPSYEYAVVLKKTPGERITGDNLLHIPAIDVVLCREQDDAVWLLLKGVSTTEDQVLRINPKACQED